MEPSQNITQIIIDTINTIFENMFSSIDNTLYSLLDELTFISSDILNDRYFQDILGTSTSSGILLVANALLFAFILYYGIKFLLSHLTYDRIDRPSSFFIKIILFGICMNSSFFIIQLFIDFISNISLFIRSIGEDLFHETICFSTLISNINTNISINTSGNNKFRQQVTSNKDLYSAYTPGLAGIPLSEKLVSPAVLRNAAANGDANLYLRNILYYIKEEGDFLAIDLMYILVQ